MLKSMYTIQICRQTGPMRAGKFGRCPVCQSKPLPLFHCYLKISTMTQEPYSTTVRVYSDTKNTLDDMKRRGESYDQVIQRLIRERNDDE